MDDEFNVIGGDDELVYPDDQNFPTHSIANDEPTVLTELNGIGRKSVKRRFRDSDEIVHPIDWHMNATLHADEREAKRQKQLIENELIDRMTTKIIDQRNRRHSQIPKLDEFAEDGLSEESRILCFPPTDGSKWIGISSADNSSRYYIRYLKTQTRSKNLSNQHTGLRSATALLDLLEEERHLREEKARKLEREQERITEEGSSRSPDSELWNTKYAPKNYFELLGDDTINRDVLIWLKLWDECVFKKKSAEFENIVTDKNREAYTLDNGKPRRPNQKVLLLSGPAGLGKTTMAGIIARHCGYATVEVNASDNRNIADFDRVIEGALRSTRNIDAKSGGKPNCLIMDEIDGAPGDAIRFLVKTIQMTGKKSIRRPIICICNNLYAPALRELRPIALNVVVLPTRRDRLVERLAQITSSEDVRVDHAALSHLVQLCHCDVRLSLNLLQYVSSVDKAEKKVITISEIEKAAERENIGNDSIFESWATILDYSKHLDGKGVLQTVHKRMKTIEKVILTFGDDRFVTGLHANFVRLPLPMGTLRKAAAEFLLYDRLNITIAHTQNYGLMKYLFAFYCSLHLTVATHHKVQLKYPQFEQNIALRSRESLETVNAVRSSLLIANNPTSLVTDILPLLVTIVQPTIKPMNEQLYGAKDLLLISKVVEIMSFFNITYSSSTINGQVQYTFQPPIDVLTLYNLSDVNHRVFLSNAMRQLITKRVDQYKTRVMIQETMKNASADSSSVPKNHAMDRIVPKKMNQNKLPVHYKLSMSCHKQERGDPSNVLERIENVIIHFLHNLYSKEKRKLCLKVSDDISEVQLDFTVRKYSKLAFNLCTLAQVYKLLITNSESTKRDLYYDNKLLYGSQTLLDRSLTAICELLSVTRSQLNVISSSKGLVAGPIAFMGIDGRLIDCRANATLISESLIGLRILTTARYIVVVEKDATFQKLLDENFLEILPDAVLVTGKGYPDICTRNFLKWVVGSYNLDIFGLFDADPHGIEIMLTYKYGSMSEKMEGKGAYIPTIKWIGLKPTDCLRFVIAENQYLPLSHRDYKKLVRLRRRSVILKEFDLVQEVDFLREIKKKLEIEAVSSIGHQFLVKKLIETRIMAEQKNSRTINQENLFRMTHSNKF